MNEIPTNLKIFGKPLGIAHSEFHDRICWTERVGLLSFVLCLANKETPNSPFYGWTGEIRSIDGCLLCCSMSTLGRQKDPQSVLDWMEAGGRRIAIEMLEMAGPMALVSADCNGMYKRNYWFASAEEFDALEKHYAEQKRLSGWVVLTLEESMEFGIIKPGRDR